MIARIPSRATSARTLKQVGVVALIASALAVGVQSTPAAAASFVVTTTNDLPDQTLDGVCKTQDDNCSLRAAIEEANSVAGSDTISFAIPGPGVHTISLGSALPALSGVGTTIDGYTQSGSRVNTDPLVSNAVITVAIRGDGPSAFDAVVVTSANNVIRGLAIYDARDKILITGTTAAGNLVVGNFVGTNPENTFFETTVVDNSSGVVMRGGAHDNHVGLPNLADRNVIGGNAHQGVALYGEFSTRDNFIQNNLIGLRKDGRARLENQLHGVDVNYGTRGTLIGGTGPLDRNVVSGNRRVGIEISHDSANPSAFNQVINNFVGTDVSGTLVTSYSSNNDIGIHIEDNVADNLVRGNIVGGNFSGGIQVDGASKRNVIDGNFVGVTPGGVDIGNKGFGIKFDTGAQFSTVSANTIAYNGQGGIVLDNGGSDRNRITRNSIFLNDGLPGIDIAPLGVVNTNDPGDVDTGPNQQLNHPVLRAATSTQVSGNACRNCTVEVFRSDGATIPSGIQYLTTVQANAEGNFVVPVGLVSDTTIVMTATDAPSATQLSNNTSEFSPATFVPPADPGVDPDPEPYPFPGPGPGEPDYQPLFTGVTPARLFDTRPGEPDGAVAVSKQFYGGTAELRVKVTGVAGVPASGVGAVSLNVTVAGAVGAGFVTVYPCGERPLASNLNYVAGQVVPNAVLVPVSASGEICLFSSNNAYLIADVNGWFASDRGFEGLSPTRVFDTRPGEPEGVVPVAKQLYGGTTELRVKVTGVAGVPDSGVGAVSLNVTAAGAVGAGFVTVYPCGTRPLASNLNYVAGQVVPNAVLVPVSDTGEICLFSSNNAHLIADINGWFAAGSGFDGLSPTRVFDTRPGEPDGVVPVAKQLYGGTTEVRVKVTGVAGVPSTGVGAVSLNVTVAGAVGAGFVTVYPCGTRPLASNLNYIADQVVPNAVLVPVSPDGEICLFSSNNAYLIADINGWFAS